MCVVSIAWEVHPRWKLIAIGNRDEFHDRASDALSPWADAPSILAGRDLLSRGSWIGVHTDGRFGVVTNIRNPDGPDPTKKSRGALVTDWLSSGALPTNVETFSPFNLVLADREGLTHIANRPNAVHEKWPSGIFGLSNAEVGAPWPRKDRLNSALEEWFETEGNNPVDLFDGLLDEERPSSGDAPIFIRNNIYGTRCSTLVAVDRDGGGVIMERRFDPDGHFAEENHFTFDWPI
ncbi:MAG: NRDE family protein [Sphingorhabdus sp.]